MSVHYKFKSSLDYDTVTFDGLHISVGDLKKSIIQQKKIGKSSDFDLQITNAQTKEVYKDDETLIPKNSSIVVARVPIPGASKKSWERSDSPSVIISKSGDYGPDGASGNKLAKTADLTASNASEEDKIKAMMSQSTQDYDPSKYVKVRNMTGPIPSTYQCYRCGKSGHWIKNCPTNAIEVKRSTGIPRSFMIAVEGPEVPGALLTSTGHFAVPLIDHEAYKEGKKEKPPFAKEPTPEKEVKPIVPEELACMICRDLLADAVLIACCGNSYCDECVRQALLDSEEHECPTCHEKDISPDTLIPNRFLRTAVQNFKNQTGYTKAKKIVKPEPTVTSPSQLQEQEPLVASPVQAEVASPISTSTDVKPPSPASIPQDMPTVPETVPVVKTEPVVKIEPAQTASEKLASKPDSDVNGSPKPTSDVTIPPKQPQPQQLLKPQPTQPGLAQTLPQVQPQTQPQTSQQAPQPTPLQAPQQVPQQAPPARPHHVSQYHFQRYPPKYAPVSQGTEGSEGGEFAISTITTRVSRQPPAIFGDKRPPMPPGPRPPPPGAYSESHPHPPHHPHPRIIRDHQPVRRYSPKPDPHFVRHGSAPHEMPPYNQPPPPVYSSTPPPGSMPPTNLQPHHIPPPPNRMFHPQAMPPHPHGYPPPMAGRPPMNRAPPPAPYPNQPPPPGAVSMPMPMPQHPLDQPPPPGIPVTQARGPPNAAAQYDYYKPGRDKEHSQNALDDFERDLMQYRRSQRRRRTTSRSSSRSYESSRSSSRSRSHSISRSISRSPSRSRSFSYSRSRSSSLSHSRSRSISRSRTRYRRSRSRSRSRRRRSPGYRRSYSRSPFTRHHSPMRREYSPGYYDQVYPRGAAYPNAPVAPMTFSPPDTRGRGYHHHGYNRYEDYHQYTGNYENRYEYQYNENYRNRDKKRSWTPENAERDRRENMKIKPSDLGRKEDRIHSPHYVKERDCERKEKSSSQQKRVQKTKVKKEKGSESRSSKEMKTRQDESSSIVESKPIKVDGKSKSSSKKEKHSASETEGKSKEKKRKLKVKLDQKIKKRKHTHVEAGYEVSEGSSSKQPDLTTVNNSSQSDATNPNIIVIKTDSELKTKHIIKEVPDSTNSVSVTHLNSTAVTKELNSREIGERVEAKPRVVEEAKDSAEPSSSYEEDPQNLSGASSEVKGETSFGDEEDKQKDEEDIEDEYQEDVELHADEEEVESIEEGNDGENVLTAQIPELSKWEREESDGDETVFNRESKKESSSKHSHSLPADIVQRAEKAILDKPVKPSVIPPVDVAKSKQKPVEKKVKPPYSKTSSPKAKSGLSPDETREVRGSSASLQVTISSNETRILENASDVEDTGKSKREEVADDNNAKNRIRVRERPKIDRSRLGRFADVQRQEGRTLKMEQERGVRSPARIVSRHDSKPRKVTEPFYREVDRHIRHHVDDNRGYPKERSGRDFYDDRRRRWAADERNKHFVKRDDEYGRKGSSEEEYSHQRDSEQRLEDKYRHRKYDRKEYEHHERARRPRREDGFDEYADRNKETRKVTSHLNARQSPPPVENVRTVKEKPSADFQAPKKYEESSPSKQRERKKSVIDESTFEPDYDETTGSDEDINPPGEEKINYQAAPVAEKRASSVSPDRQTKKLKRAKKPSESATEGEIFHQTKESELESATENELSKVRRRSESSGSSSSDSGSESPSSVHSESVSPKKLDPSAQLSQSPKEKRKHKKSKHKKHKKHKHKHKKKKSHHKSKHRELKDGSKVKSAVMKY